MDLEEFELHVTYPTLWQSTARMHICAANVLFEHYEDATWDENGGHLSQTDDIQVDVNSALLLYAYAIENMIKAVLIAKSSIPPIKDGKLNPTLTTHKLRKLFSFAKVSITKREADVLDALETIVSSGKYPIARSPADSGPYGYTMPDAIIVIGEILERLENELRSIVPNAKAEQKLLHLCRQKPWRIK